MDKPKNINDIFNSDPFGLLEVKADSPSAQTEDERLVASFNEINAFFEKHKREPQAGGDVHEHMLYSRLKGLRENDAKKQLLMPYDQHGLLKVELKIISSIKDVLADDTLGILSSEADNIFDLKYLPKGTTMPDYIASRKPCGDFHNFEDLFKKCQKELSKGKRRLHPFKNEQQIEKGCFFVLKGVLLYVEEVGERKPDENGKVNARLRCIFENGTESDMLLRSLSAELYKNGRRVTEHEDKLLNPLKGITADDKEAGFIYILKSNSMDVNISSIKDLYKIGYCTVSVEERVKNAESEPTYLMAPVSIVSVFQCYNMNSQKLEQLLHNFFGSSCLNIDIYDNNRQSHTPREWFIAPLSVIEDAIHFIVNGEIVNYKYNRVKQLIETKEK